MAFELFCKYACAQCPRGFEHDMQDSYSCAVCTNRVVLHCHDVRHGPM